MSIKKIAELAGTSVSTVSRVLNHPSHNCNEPGLEKKIWDIAHELNYRPNTFAQNLRTGNKVPSSPLTVDIFLTRFDSIEKDMFFNELYQHIKEELLQMGWLLGEVLSAVDIVNLGDPSEATEFVPYKPASLAQPIREKDNTGLIILGKCPSNLVPILKKRYHTIAGIDRNPTEYEYDEVICNGTTAAQKAVEYLISLGHKNIAYIGDCTYESRYIGYYQALLNHKLSLDYANIHPSDQTKEEGREIMNEILQSEHRPTAIFCANDSTAIGALEALKKDRKKGYYPSIISIDNIEASQKTSPMLTTIDIPKKEMVHFALSLLYDRQKGHHTETVRMELPCRLIVRESCNTV